jgi:hypothetical protein
MNELFEVIKSADINEGNARDIISNWSDKRFFNFLSKCLSSVYKEESPKTSIFHFVANSQLSGLPYPCSSLQCRIEHADKMARFAALYSDKVYIRNPFERYFHLDELDYDDRILFSDDILVLLHLKDLFKSDILHFSTNNMAFCPDCYAKFVKNIADSIDHKMRDARKLLKSIFIKEASFKSYFNLEPIVEVRAPGKLIENCHSLTVINKIPRGYKKYFISKKPKALNQTIAQKLGVVDSYVDKIISDLTIQNWYSNLYDLNYVTDREIDLELISIFNDPTLNKFNKAIIDGFAHNVPILNNIALIKIVELRSQLKEEFNVYRDAIRTATMEITNSNATYAKQIFNDIILPELNNIDLAVKNSRRILRKNTTRSFIISTGFISLGLFSGILPGNIGQLLAAMGGYGFVKDSIKGGLSLLNEPESIRDNKFYFLWKVQKSLQGINH